LELDPASVDQATRLAFGLFLFVASVTLVWVLSSIAKSGGLSRMIAAAALAQTNIGVRQVWLENKLFEGMRLIYTGFIGLGIFGAGVLSIARSGCKVHPRTSTFALIILAFSVLVLSVLPIILSQRILLLYLMFGAYASACMVAGRVIGVQFALAAAIMFFGVWTLVEAFTVKNLGVSALSVSTQKILYYFLNDFSNGITPIGKVTDLYFGYFSFWFLLFFTNFDKAATGAMYDKLRDIAPYLGGGEFPMLTGPYIDFGIGGLLLLAIYGVGSNWIFNRGVSDPRYGILYGAVAPCLILSVHNNYFAHQNFWFNLGIVLLLASRLRFA
jgi:hypothetical protein